MRIRSSFVIGLIGSISLASMAMADGDNPSWHWSGDRTAKKVRKAPAKKPVAKPVYVAPKQKKVVDYNPPVTQAYEPAPQYQPPAPVYQPPVQTYQPPPPPVQTYQPPVQNYSDANSSMRSYSQQTYVAPPPPPVAVAPVAVVYGASQNTVQKQSSPWGFAVSAGVESFVGGKFVQAANSAVFDGTVFNAAMPGNAKMYLKGRNFGDIYKPALRTAIEIRHAAGEYSEYFANLSYLKAQSKSNILFGCYELQTAVGTCASELRGDATDLKQYAFELGYRQWFAVDGFAGFMPYYAVHGGIVHTDKIHLNMNAGANSLYNCCYYEATNSYTAGGELGVSKRIGSSAEFAAEIGIRYTSKLKGATSTNFDLAGLGSINDNASILSVPVNLRFQSSF